jgi:hypothetical protein
MSGPGWFQNPGLASASGTVTAKGAATDPTFDAVKTATGALGNVTTGLGMLNTASHLGGGSVASSLEAADKSPLGRVLGPLGTVLNIQQMANAGNDISKDVNREGWGQAYHDPELYSHMGSMQSGLSHLVLPELGAPGKILDLGLSGVEVGLNTAGSLAGQAFGDKAKFTSDSVAGGILRKTYGDQSPGEAERQLIRNVAGDNPVANAAGTAADVATNLFLSPVTSITSAGAVAADEVSKIFDW